MTTRAPFLSQRYGAYYHREVPEPDEEMTQRRPRHSVRGLSAALLAPGHRVRCIDRPSQKHQGVGRRACGLPGWPRQRWRAGTALLPPGAPPWSMARSRETEYAAAITAGSLVSTGRFSIRRANRRKAPSKKDCATGAYPIIEYKGLVFTYMGPPELRPPFPMYDIFKGRARLLPRQAGKGVLGPATGFR